VSSRCNNRFRNFASRGNLTDPAFAPLGYNPATVRTRLANGESFVLETVMLRERYRKIERSTDHSQCVRNHPVPDGGRAEACPPLPH
jgi:hypothetical protein